MAVKRGFDGRSGLIGAAVTLLLLAVVAAVVIFGGFFPVAASSKESVGVATLVHAAMESGVERSAKGLKSAPLSAADVREGAGHFKAMCQGCHGGPGVEPQPFATAMNPAPPNLADEDEWNRAQIFWIAKNGIKMSAMPAFGKVDDDEELWKIAAFVETLRKTSPADYAAVPSAHEHDEHAEVPAAR